MPRVFVTRLIPEEGLSMLRGVAETRVWEDELPPDRETLVRELRDCSGLVCLLTDRLDSEIMDGNPSLLVISNFAVGFDNIDVAAATERGIPVGHTPGVLTDTTADFAFALLMAAARRVVEGAEYVRSGHWKTWGPRLLTGVDVHHATLGIVGFGRIGQKVARRASGFDMKVLYYDVARNPELESGTDVSYASFERLCRESDFVSIHTDLNETTRHMFDQEAFARMKSSAVIVNTARGPIIDPAALHEALAAGKIRAAALDVTDPEPLPPDSPLLQLDNCIVVPHIASASVATRARMAEMAAANVIAGLRGEPLPTCLNPEVYESGKLRRAQPPRA